MKNINWGKIFFVITIAFIVAVLSVLHVIIGAAQTKPGMVYLATGHYYLDFFEYVAWITQGMKGKWLMENYFATDDPLKTFIGLWQYLMYGKIGNLFHLSPIVTYWVAVALFSFILTILIFIAIKKLLNKESFLVQAGAFLLAIFAGPFIKIFNNSDGLFWVPYTIWGDRGVFFRRFEPVPYHLTSLILTLICLLMFSNVLEKISTFNIKQIIFRTLISLFILLFLLTYSPQNVILLMITLGFSGFVLSIRFLIKKRRKEFLSTVLFVGLICLVIVPAAFIFKHYYQTLDFFKRVSEGEIVWQVFPTLREFFLITGPILILSLLGLFKLFRKITISWIIFITFVVASYYLYLSTIPFKLGTTNTRFLSALNPILFGALGGLGLHFFVYGIVRKGRKLFITILFIFLAFFAISNAAYFFPLLQDINISSPVTYLPKGMIDGFRYLDLQPDRRPILTSPAQFLGTILPIYVDSRVYLARGVVTPDYDKKLNIVDSFYLGKMKPNEAKDFLRKNGIGFVVLTSIEGYQQSWISQSYPFLKVVYKNSDIVIFKFN
jgi:hypothetical protein